MSPPSESDIVLTQRIRAGESDAWNELIARLRGTTAGFRRESRSQSVLLLRMPSQETFIGFLTSLPNYDDKRPLETYLFSIAAHKLTDHLRREGRRPTFALGARAYRVQQF